MFEGFALENSPASFPFLVQDDAGAPVEPDAPPTWKMYASSGAVTNGSGTAASVESGNVTGATNASPIEVTSANHGLVSGQRVTVSNVAGNTAANGTFTATKTGTNTFTLNGSTGSGAYTSGGTWRTTGLYAVSLAGAVLSSLAAGNTYVIVIYWSVGGDQKSLTITFTVR